MIKRFFLPFLGLAIFCYACNDHGANKTAAQKNGDTVSVKKSTVKENQPPLKRPPILNIVDTVSAKRIIVCMKDSATTYERIAGKLARIYGEKLAEVFKKSRIKPAGPPMAWYKTQKSPYFFEAGIPVNKRPDKLPKGAFIKETYADSIILAHFFGPYDLIPQGYAAVKDWIKETGKMANGAIYEIYVSDPIDKKGKPVDPYKVQTDIVFPRK